MDGDIRRTSPDTKFEVDHFHEGVECNLVMRGTGRLIIGDETFSLRPGTLIWIPAGQSHRLLRSALLEMWVIWASPKLLPPHLAETVDRLPVRMLPGEELVELDRLLVQVAQDSDDPAAYSAGIRYALIRALRASADSAPSHSRPMHAAVSRALLILRETDASISLPELASAAGVGAPYLSRLLVVYTGWGFLEWRNRIRLQRFLTSYRPGDNFLRAAIDAGFGSYSRFRIAFQQIMNCTPSEWLRKGGDDRSMAMVVPDTTSVSTRLRWVRLVPFVSADIPLALGDQFMERFLAVRPSATSEAPASVDRLVGKLTIAERQHFISRLLPDLPVEAGEFHSLLGKHDFLRTYAWVIGSAGLSADRLSHAIGSTLLLLWTAAHQAGDPSERVAQAVAAQAGGAMRSRFKLLQPDLTRAIHNALICHFVVIYHALQAARASGEIARRQLSSQVVDTARRMFGADLMSLFLSPDGFGRHHGRGAP